MIPQQQEIAMGQEAAQQIVGQMGLYPDDALQNYVSRLGLALAAASERPELPWKFYVLDDPLVNAFALPGGQIFITRGILSHMNSEAELVSVLGHEIGHVTAKHSVSQISQQQLAQIGLGLGTVLMPELVGPWSDVASAGLGLLFLKFGRDAERQADELGFRYMLKQGYDPRAMARVLHTLDKYGEQGGRSRGIPEWASTHPAPENRVAATDARVQALPVDANTLKVEREGFLAQLDGMTFGDDPRQGYFNGNTFYHPDLGFKLEFPKGWKAVNQPQSVVAVSPGQDAGIQLTLAGKKAPREYAQQFFQKSGAEAGRYSTDAVNGFPAFQGYFRANTQQGIVAGLVSWIALGENTYQIVAFTPDPQLQGYIDAFVGASKSFTKITDRAALNIKPARISLVRADRNMSLAEFQKRYPSSIPLAQLALINGIDAGATIRIGQTVKRVQGGAQL